MDFLETYYTDVYKVGHKPMLPEGSTLMYSNLTPRSGKLSNIPNSKGIISIGQQKTVRKLKSDWQKNFFDRPVEELDQFAADMGMMLMQDGPIDVSHMKELHALGYLPIRIKAIKEGTFIPYKVPMLTIVNTKPLNGIIVDWLVNYLETILSAESWQAPTSATTGFAFRKLGHKWIEKTDPENMWFLDYMFHDFSMRGQTGKSAIINSGLGWAACSRGSDTLPVIPAARMYYDEPLNEVVINSVIATEHAIMCALTGFYLQKKDGSWDKIGELEVETFRYLLEKFPKGILSIVSDTWDLWRVLTEYCAVLKDEILAREGKLVFRPDSGDPVDIICGLDVVDDFKNLGNYDAKYSGLPIKAFKTQPLAAKWGNKIHRVEKIFCKDEGEDRYVIDTSRHTVDPNHIKGVIELLWDIFGGTETSKGYKKLNEKVGAIYGDSINFDRGTRIFQRLAAKGFASTNVVLGVGSYSLQFVTRDTHGMAQKATYIEIEVEGVTHGIEIFKDPITDSGIKKSAKGLMRVIPDPQEKGELFMMDQQTWEQEAEGYLQIIFEDGEFFNETTFTQIRERVNAQLQVELQLA